MGIDPTGKENIKGDNTEQWRNGHVFSFWAYDYNYPGTKEYHVYYTQNNHHGVFDDTQRYTLSPIKTSEDGEKNEWNLTTSFWAFEDDPVRKFTGKFKPMKIKYFYSHKEYSIIVRGYR